MDNCIQKKQKEIILIANIFGVDSFRSFWSNAERMDGYIGLIHMFGFLCAGWGIMRAHKEENSQLINVAWVVVFLLSVGQVFPLFRAQVGADQASWWIMACLLAAAAALYPALYSTLSTRPALYRAAGELSEPRAVPDSSPAVRWRTA